MKKFQEAIKDPLLDDDYVYVNDKYQVNVKEMKGGWKWLSIKRKDKRCIKDWRELQEIKNAICGPEFEALELYPAESRLVDTSNQFHLFVLPEGLKFPFGYNERLVSNGDGYLDKDWGFRQRPFKNIPKDVLSNDEIKERLRTKIIGGKK